MTAFDRTDGTIRVSEVSAGVAHLRLDRRDRLNAITPDLLTDLGDALDALARDDGTRVLIVSGAGPRAFSVGADRDVLDGLDAERATALARRGQETFGRLERFPGPVIAAIDGYCLGGGMELATCADLRIAGPDATFGQPETDRGLVPGWGGTQRLARVVGRGRATEVILTADEYDAETMRRYGFVTELADDPLDRATERALALADRPPLVNRCAKRALRHDGSDGLDCEATAFGRLAARRAGAAGDGADGRTRDDDGGVDGGDGREGEDGGDGREGEDGSGDGHATED